MSKFRNIVVHDCARIDPEIVTGILRKDLAGFKAYALEIICFIDRIDPPNMPFFFSINIWTFATIQAFGKAKSDHIRPN